MTPIIRHRFLHYLVHGMSTRIWAPGILLVILVNSFSRSWLWNYEWLWAMDTLSFSSIFLVPLCAGIAAFEAGRLARARELHLVSPGGIWAVLRAGIGVWVVTAMMILLSLLIISGSVLYWTAGLMPRPNDLLPVPLLLAIVAAGCAAGTLIGWRFPGRLAPGLAVLGIFALLMSGYIVGRGTLANLVSVGSATGSLIGLRLSPRLMLWQCLFYGAITVGAAWLIRLRAAPVHWWHRGAAIGCALAVVITGLGALGAGTRFISAPVAERICTGNDPQICLLPGYASQAGQLRAEVSPYLEALGQAGADVPDQVIQVEVPTDANALQVGSRDIVDFDDQFMINALLDWYRGDGCTGWGGYEHRGQDPSRIVWDWIALRVDGAQMHRSSDVDWETLSTEEQDEILRQAINRLSTECQQQ